MTQTAEKVGMRTPVVTLLLITANLLAAFLILANPDLVLEWGFRVQSPRLQTALVSLFLHANVLHLLGNMVFLAAVGAAVELSTGSLRFIIVYFVGGVLGILVHWLAVKNASQPVPLIGASGAIASCAAYYGVRYRQMKVPILPNKAVPVIAIVFLWIILQVLGGFVRIGDESGVSYWAHLGGAIAGVLLSLVFVAPDLGQLRLKHEALARLNEQGPGAVAEAARRHLQDHPKDPKALRVLVASCEKMGDREEEARTLYQLFDVVQDDERPGVVARLARLNSLSGFTFTQLLQQADRNAANEPDLSKTLLLQALQLSDGRQRPEVLAQLLGLTRESDIPAAKTWAKELEVNYPLHPATELARKRGWM